MGKSGFGNNLCGFEGGVIQTCLGTSGEPLEWSHPKPGPLGELRRLCIGMEQFNWVTKISVEGAALPSTAGGCHLNLFPAPLTYPRKEEASELILKELF